MPNLGTRFRISLFNRASNIALRTFEGRTRHASRINLATLRKILHLNQHTHFGLEHDLPTVTRASDLAIAFQRQVPLSNYRDYAEAIERIAAGHDRVLTADPVTQFAGSAGTTSEPKRIPRTARAQRKSMTLIVLAEQGVINRGISGATGCERGINLMSLYQPSMQSSGVVRLTSGPNVGLQRMRRQIPVRWASPIPVFDIRHRPSAFYLHALFGLAEPRALYISALLAPGVVGWLTLIERDQEQLVRDLATGSLAKHLHLSAHQREAVRLHLHPNPARARSVAAEFARGFENIVPRLWPHLKYIRTITSGTFATSLPRLRWFVGDNLPIHSGSYVSAEGMIGINLATDGTSDYVLACGNAYYEFIPLADVGSAQPSTISCEAVEIGQDYEIVLTTYAGLYRYRLGDIVRVVDFYGTAPILRVLYRRGTILNLVGEKTTELHTSQALHDTFDQVLGTTQDLKDYAVTIGYGDNGLPHYTFYVEVVPGSAAVDRHQSLATRLDRELCSANPYYWSNGREAERLGPLRLRVVRDGTFDTFLDLQVNRSRGVNTSLVKVPRAVSAADHLALLESSVIAPVKEAPHGATAATHSIKRL